MKNYKEIEEKWSEQSPASFPLPVIIESVKRKQYYTVAVLTITAIILISFYIWVFNPKEQIFNLGLALMISSVVARILVELFSIKRLNGQRPDESVIVYHNSMLTYHKQRLKVHRLWTPLLLVVYWTGFVLLIATFKIYLSPFMFQYVCWSSVPIAIVMVWFIRVQISKEQRQLVLLKTDFNESDSH